MPAEPSEAAEAKALAEQQAKEQAEAKALAEQQAKEEALAELARLRAQLERLQGDKAP